MWQHFLNYTKDLVLFSEIVYRSKKPILVPHYCFIFHRINSITLLWEQQLPNVPKIILLWLPIATFDQLPISDSTKSSTRGKEVSLTLENDLQPLNTLLSSVVSSVLCHLLQLINTIHPSELGSYLRQPDVVDNETQLCTIFQNFNQTPEFLENVRTHLIIVIVTNVRFQ